MVVWFGGRRSTSTRCGRRVEGGEALRRKSSGGAVASALVCAGTRRAAQSPTRSMPHEDHGELQLLSPPTQVSGGDNRGRRDTVASRRVYIKNSSACEASDWC